MDFYHVYPRFIGPSADWYFVNLFFSPLTKPAELTMDCNGAVLDTRVYKRLFDVVPNDRWEPFRYQWLALNQFPVTLPKAGKLSVIFVGTTETFKTEQSPYPKTVASYAGDDVRMAAGVYMVYDMDTGFSFEYFLTNDRVYVGYTRTSLARTEVNDYAAFTFLIPVKMRKPCDWHRLKIVLDSEHKTVTWILDKRQVFVVNKVGYRLSRQFMVVDIGGNELPAFPKKIQYGFGSMTMLDAYPACQKGTDCCDCRFPTLREGLFKTIRNPIRKQMNPLLGAPTPAVYYEDKIYSKPNYELDYQYWGQGSISKLRYLAVYTNECPE